MSIRPSIAQSEYLTSGIKRYTETTVYKGFKNNGKMATMAHDSSRRQSRRENSGEVEYRVI